jgi:hypothetical protein
MRRGWIERVCGVALVSLVGGLACGLTGTARADEPSVGSPTAPRGTIQVPIRLSELRTLRVTPRGEIDGGFGSRACNVVSSHTDANFEGGSYVAQAGFSQNEMFAATYTVPVADWPIKHNQTEVLVVTSATTVTTVTQWSLLFYEGEPTTGTLVATYSSDGDILPHIQIPPGTNGVNLQFLIDPNDPEQLILNDNGSRKFTVAFRIDRHNQPPTNPCTTAPDARRNAFPCTDVSGLAVSTANWLFGLNCGGFGCPPNGGWARFSQLTNGLCRPTGDWVSRTTWSSLNCTPGVGACCLPDGSCVTTSSGECIAAGGTFQGDGAACGNCPQPTGACCFSNGFCISGLTAEQCSGAGGNFAGANTNCGANNSCPTGACCLPNGSCITTTAGECALQSGTFRGVGTNCANANCPQPTGACCFSTGFCLSLTNAQCSGAGGTWAGAFTTCADGNGNGQADICESGCPADFNGDGFLDFFDYDEYVTCFEIADCPPGKTADFNGDDFVDFFDYDDFVSQFESGC